MIKLEKTEVVGWEAAIRECGIQDFLGLIIENMKRNF